jgi:hypothetical protein
MNSIMKQIIAFIFFIAALGGLIALIPELINQGQFEQGLKDEFPGIDTWNPITQFAVAFTQETVNEDAVETLFELLLTQLSILSEYSGGGGKVNKFSNPVKALLRKAISDVSKLKVKPQFSLNNMKQYLIKTFPNTLGTHNPFLDRIKKLLKMGPSNKPGLHKTAVNFITNTKGSTLKKRRSSLRSSRRSSRRSTNRY